MIHLKLCATTPDHYFKAHTLKIVLLKLFLHIQNYVDDDTWENYSDYQFSADDSSAFRFWRLKSIPALKE